MRSGATFCWHCCKSTGKAGKDPVSCGNVPADGKGTGNNYAIETDDNVIKENLHQEQNTILDLGCGTGTLTQLLAAQGYDMIGID